MPLDGIGAPLRLNQLDTSLWETQPFSLASLVHERALSYRCRTHDAAHADLFYVPAYKGRVATEVSCAETVDSQLQLLQRLMLALPNTTQHRAGGAGLFSGFPRTLDARGGADHIILNPRSGMPWERFPYCELTLNAPQLGAALHLAMEAHPHNATWSYPDGCDRACVTHRSHQLAEEWYWSVPWTSMVHLDTSAGSTPPWASAHTRQTLVAADFGASHNPPLAKTTLHLRQRLLESCRAQPKRCKCPPPASGSERTVLLYWDSKFCLQPGGDTLTRKGIVDAVLLGCIPVLFHEGQLAQWPWHWGSCEAAPPPAPPPQHRSRLWPVE